MPINLNIKLEKIVCNPRTINTTDGINKRKVYDKSVNCPKPLSDQYLKRIIEKINPRIKINNPATIPLSRVKKLNILKNFFLIGTNP